MKPIQGYHLITSDDLHWRPSNLMKIPNADFLERTGSEILCKDVISGKRSPRRPGFGVSPKRTLIGLEPAKRAN